MGKKATYLFPLSDTPIARGLGKENKLCNEILLNKKNENITTE